MPLRYRICAVLTALGLAVAATTALAAKPAPQVEPYDGLPLQDVVVGTPYNTHSTCVLGETGAPAWLINYVAPPDDAYLQLIRPSDCAACSGPGGVIVTKVNMLINFRVVCTQQVAVYVVAAAGDAACRVPDANNVLCGPLYYNLTPPAAGNYNFSMPLPPGCCITQDAFIAVNFITPGTGCSTSTTVPRLITTAACNACQSYNVWSGGTDDLCVDIGFPGNPILNADVDCCNVVPTTPHSWGSIKTLYR